MQVGQAEAKRQLEEGIKKGIDCVLLLEEVLGGGRDDLYDLALGERAQQLAQHQVEEGGHQRPGLVLQGLGVHDRAVQQLHDLPIVAVGCLALLLEGGLRGEVGVPVDVLIPL